MKKLFLKFKPASSYLFALLLISLFLFSGCTFIPSSGPSGYKIRKQAGQSKKGNSLEYCLLSIDQQTVDILNDHLSTAPCMAVRPRPVMSRFPHQGIESIARAGKQTIQPGDAIRVDIFEAGGGLYRPIIIEGGGGGTPVTSLPPQVVDQSGMISIPYAGQLSVVGKIPGIVAQEITKLLQVKTIDPQVIVTVANRSGGDLVTIAGDVQRSSQIPITLAGTRLIDAIASAGGPAGRPHETLVALTRNGITRSDTLQAIFDNPVKNIYLQPSDTILLRKLSMNYMVFGASGSVGTIPLDVEDLSLAQAMGRTGGANDMKANPRGIFLYREETRKTVEALAPKGKYIPAGDTIPVIYQLQLQDPKGFFYAGKFYLRDQDIIYYTNANMVGLTKFSALLNTLISPVTRSTFDASRIINMTSPSVFPLFP